MLSSSFNEPLVDNRMGFWKTICSPYRNMFSWTGRANRKEYWLFMIFSTIIPPILFLLTIILIISIIALFLSLTGQNTPPSYDLGKPDFPYAIMYAMAILVGLLDAESAPIVGAVIWLILFMCFFLLPFLSLCVRRLHDIELSGWWLIVFMLVGFGAVVIEELFIAETDASIKLMFSAFPIVLALLWFYIFFLRKGTPGPNRFEN